LGLVAAQKCAPHGWHDPAPVQVQAHEESHQLCAGYVGASRDAWEKGGESLPSEMPYRVIVGFAV
jgi:hypothetical protein